MGLGLGLGSGLARRALLCEGYLLLDRAASQVLQVELHPIELGAASEAVTLHEHHGQGLLRQQRVPACAGDGGAGSAAAAAGGPRRKWRERAEGA